MNFGVVLFHTSSAAFRAEQACLDTGLTVRLIPTPRQFSSDCGIALRFSISDRAAVSELLERHKIEHAGLKTLA